MWAKMDASLLISKKQMYSTVGVDFNFDGFNLVKIFGGEYICKFVILTKKWNVYSGSAIKYVAV